MRRRKLRELRIARADAGLTISELAERAGVARDTVAKAEQGRRKPHPITLSKIARALGVSTAELLEGRDRPKASRPDRWGHQAEQLTAGAEIGLVWNVRALAGAEADLRWKVHEVEELIADALESAATTEEALARAQVMHEVVDRKLEAALAG